jgi:hypothetical protein
MCAPTTQAQLLLACEEVDDLALQEAVRLRCGPVTEQDRNKMQTHLHNLASLVDALAAHSPALWSSKQQRVFGYQPAELFASMRQEAEHFLTPAEQQRILADRLRVVVSDPVGADLGHASVTGDSDLRPESLYPPSI